MNYYEYNCARCGGFVGEPMKAYGYAGQWCHCAEPKRPEGNLVSVKTSTSETTDDEQLTMKYIENDVQKITELLFAGVPYKSSNPQLEKVKERLILSRDRLLETQALALEGMFEPLPAVTMNAKEAVKFNQGLQQAADYLRAHKTDKV